MSIAVIVCSPDSVSIAVIVCSPDSVSIAVIVCSADSVSIVVRGGTKILNIYIHDKHLRDSYIPNIGTKVWSIMWTLIIFMCIMLSIFALHLTPVMVAD